MHAVETCLAAALAMLGGGELPEPAAVSRQLDALVAEQWPARKVEPAPLADDGTYRRRVWLDLAGRIPPFADTEALLAKESTLNRQPLVEELLASPQAANHWGRVWAEYYLDARPFEQGTYNGRLLQRFLFEAFQQNKSYRQIARDMLAGEGTSDVSGPANFLLRYEASPPMLAGAVSKKFLGVTLQCAQCHDHPHVHWKQDEFWGLAAFFARLRRMNPTEEPEGDTFAVVLERRRGELQIPDNRAKPKEDGTRPTKVVYPRTPGSTAIDTSEERRQALLDWLVHENNPYFARHFVNQTWRQFFGRELVPTLDQILKAPSDAIAAADARRQILDLLAADFAAGGYDIKRLLRVIVLSQTYQRSTGTTVDAELPPEELARREAAELEHFARFPMRPLTSDQLYLSIAQATGYRGDDQSVHLGEITMEDFAADLPGQYFGSQPLSLPRSVALLNGDFARGAADLLAAAATRLHGPTAGARHVEWMFVSCLCRRPTPEELDVLLDLAGRQDGGLADVAWALMNSAEFNSIH